MNYEVSEKGGQTVRLSLQEVGEGLYEISLDGHTVHVDAVRSGRTIYSIIEDGRQFEAMVDEKGSHGFDVLIAGRLFHLEAVDERTRLLASHGTPAVSGPQQVQAEMPGKGVKIAVAEGSAVEEGQGVVVIEAMKMENELRAHGAATIEAVHVAEGSSVEGRALLLTFAG